MNIITGATGNIGKELIYNLSQKNEEVTAITRNVAKVKEIFPDSVKIAEADILDVNRLNDIFETGDAIFVLNPPADVSGNTDIEERKTVKALLQSLDLLPAKRIVVESTLGSQPGKHIGDLGVLYELEQGVKAMPHDYRIIRPAYYMSNWKMAISSAKKSGEIYSFYPEDFEMPMVAPKDIANLAAKLMISNQADRINPIVGPSKYSARDVAEMLSQLLNKKVKVKVVEEKYWESAYRAQGFSVEAAQSYANMTRISLNEEFDTPENPTIGETSLETYLASIVAL